MKFKLSEALLARAVIDWLTSQNWDVYQEVQPFAQGNIADIVAIRNGLVWAIECKLSYGLAVLDQASHWHAHFRSIAIPRRSRNNYRVASDYFQVGVLEVSVSQTWRSSPDAIETEDGDFVHLRVSQTAEPPIKREFHKLAKELASHCRPEHKYFAEAGTNRGGHYTPYKETIKQVKAYLRDNPGATLKEIIQHIRTHYSSSKSAYSALGRALETFESDWCSIDKSKRPHRYFLLSEQLPSTGEKR